MGEQTGSNVAALRSVVQTDGGTLLVRTSRIPTGAFVIGDLDQPSVDENRIDLRGADSLDLLVDVDFSGGMTEVRLRVEWSNDRGATWQADGALDPQAVAASVRPLNVVQNEYRLFVFPLVDPKSWRISVPALSSLARVSVMATGIPAAGDLVAIRAVRHLSAA